MTRPVHGGDLGDAVSRFGGNIADWLDLSTGINRVPYPVTEISTHLWRSLPTAADHTALIDAARIAYRTDWPCLPVAGAQAAIQMLPYLHNAGRIGLRGPSYNEFATVFEGAGKSLEEVSTTTDLEGFDIAILVNPNNPDGRLETPESLRKLAKVVGLLIVDESFCDTEPETSLLSTGGADNIIVLRSFGKFFGLAGLRLGFVFGADSYIARLSQLRGPWAVSGPALSVGAHALADLDWQARTRDRLRNDAERMDQMAIRAGWTAVGGSTLFRLYQTDGARAARDRLARHRVWSRIFPYSGTWLRLGLPGDDEEWQRVETAVA
ncbi:threonine-phosphate decarboxylase CobD [Qingshengfaniella alkalisoli]|uniref:threonine-phosphate decarboxylase n=1 Tax=Qingshengfaniella alkalisoli TaxID=2599296 RepID=A0A5B8IVQ6_9RHOB|nr:threonine-phosphate decarboxylase CobD [Qingshengfaniella alkalisoli]QDY69553.1 threonine-phosphate decarboxylase [Qingshengfaniella alkalisoli]